MNGGPNNTKNWRKMLDKNNNFLKAFSVNDLRYYVINEIYICAAIPAIIMDLFYILSRLFFMNDE